MDPQDAAPGRAVDGRLIYLVENLTSLHASPDLPWLAGRFEFLGEHALGATLTALVMPDEAGTYRPVPSTSPRPAAAQALWDTLKVGRLAGNEEAAAVFRAAEGSPLPQAYDLANLFGGLAGGRTETAFVVPIAFHREHMGVGLFLVQDPEEMTDKIAATIASHAAVAIYQIREREDARRLHSVDPALWVPDEDFLRAQLRREITRARRYGRDLGIALLRLENQGEIRAKFGDFYTSHLMRRVGGQLLSSVRDTDVLGALAGAYAILHTDTGAQGTRVSAHRLRDTVGKMIAQRFPEAPAPAISVWIAALPEHGETMEALLHHLEGPAEDGQTAVA
jgi:diguanylate cyclase (GGDEF)-like protein